ncbi:MAG: hypothetical protein K8L99_26355 [Anaerolineae bacterium]|nr:hypothetical protein [Anaerolineae bacterium]
MEQRQSANEYFRTILLTVVGQAFAAAGYELEQQPVKWAGGLFRFAKALDNSLYGFIVFQVLSFSDNEWASGVPSRFRVSLVRSDLSDASRTSTHPQYARQTLSELVVNDFGVAILPDADHWWQFRTTEELGQALAEAGHLAVGYGMPWLAGDLVPPEG